MKKVFIGAIIIFLLTGCGNNSSQQKTTTDVVFKEELVAVSKIGDAKGKCLPDQLILEEIKETFNGIFDFAIFESHSEEYGEIIQGAGSDGNGGRIFCCKLPVNVKFVGTEASVHRFVEYFENVDEVVSFGDFKVETLEDEKYEVNTVINFLGKAAGSTLTNEKREFAIKKNEIEVKEEEEVSLRDFDISMIIRPSNSDSSAISLGVMGDKDYRIYSDDNDKKDVKVTFSNSGSNYYCEYSIDNLFYNKASIDPKGNILFDILSCEIIEKDDKVAIDLHVINNSNKKVSVAIYEDEDNRVNLIEKVGSVEVKK